jgi:hypothetical protein
MSDERIPVDQAASERAEHELDDLELSHEAAGQVKGGAGEADPQPTESISMNFKK